MLDDEHGRTREMTEADVDALLLKAARNADGSYRVVASKGITGKDVGPFKYYGTRPDDPNDIHPHEHRRELRAMRVFGAWLNHDDSRAINTRDFLQDVGARKIVRHYLIDFGSTLGSGSTRAQGTRAGNEYIWEARPTLISMITLGFYVRPWLKVHYPDLPAVGRFEANFFRPERWKPEYPNPAFGNARPDDLFWGARGVMAFSDETILEVSRTAAFTDPEATAYMAQTLITRRDKIGQLWLNVVLPVDDFDLTADGVLTFRNIAVESKTAAAGRGYSVAWARFDNTTGTATTVGEPQVVTEPRATAPRDALSGDFVQATLTGDHPTHAGWAIPDRRWSSAGPVRRGHWSASTALTLGLLRSSGDSYRHGAVPRASSTAWAPTTSWPSRRWPSTPTVRRRAGAASRFAWRSASRSGTRWSCWSALAPCCCWAGRFRNWSSGRARSWAGCC